MERPPTNPAKMWPYIVAAIIAYLTLVKILRYRMYRKLHTKYAQYLADPHSMPYNTAKEIFNTTMLYESPFVFGFSIQWALIKSYTIASGTKLLVSTRRLTTPANVGKRSEDTGIFLSELLVSGIDSPRGMTSLAKMNWIHSQYGSRISNPDLIHTLALFVLEPIRWSHIYDWRPMSYLESVALFIYWREIGHRMGMHDIPHTIEDLQTWTNEYEKTAMRYSKDNRACYDATVALFLRDTPSWIRPVMQRVSDAFLEDYVRPKLGVEEPPVWAFAVVRLAFGLRKMYIRHFALPRFSFLDVGSEEGRDGRIRRNRWLFEPWYVKETVGSRVKRLLGLGGDKERVPGPEWVCKGYLPEELGPKEFVERAKEPVREQVGLMRGYVKEGGPNGMGCPFAFAGR